MGMSLAFSGGNAVHAHAQYPRAVSRATVPAKLAAPARSAFGYKTARRVQLCTRAHGHGGESATESGASGHGHGGMMERPRPGEKKGFVEEMRFVAMKLHTKDQAPKEGEAKVSEEQQKSMLQWKPTREGYLQFLAESCVMYEALESIMAEASDESYKQFQNTGLERVAPLKKDLEWFKATYDMEPSATSGGVGEEYATLLKDLAKSNPPALICHFYNVYFAHSAGGRMIGTKMSEMLLDRHELDFYKYGGAEMKDLLSGVRDNLNAVAEGWSREEKDVCLEETEKSFKYSGQVLRTIVTPPKEA